MRRREPIVMLQNCASYQQNGKVKASAKIRSLQEKRPFSKLCSLSLSSLLPRKKLETSKPFSCQTKVSPASGTGERMKSLDDREEPREHTRTRYTPTECEEYERQPWSSGQALFRKTAPLDTKISFKNVESSDAVIYEC